MDNLNEISRLFGALTPWMAQVVVIGGWAHRLHRFHPAASPPLYLPVTTKDADIAFSLDEPMEGDIGAALKTAGFEADLRGDRTPPVSHYHFGNENKGFYAEFLVPLKGGLIQRNGKPVPMTIDRAGISAQKLRYLDILLLKPWTIFVDSTLGFDLDLKAQILLANPVCFMAQKVLIKGKRESDKQAQDALYIHDTLDLFGPKLDELRSLWVNSIRNELGTKISNEIEGLCLEQFQSVSDTHRDAVQIPRDRSLTADGLQRACSYGLNEIFKPI